MARGKKLTRAPPTSAPSTPAENTPTFYPSIGPSAGDTPATGVGLNRADACWYVSPALTNKKWSSVRAWNTAYEQWLAAEYNPKQTPWHQNKRTTTLVTRAKLA